MFNVLAQLGKVEAMRPYMTPRLFGLVQEADSLKDFLVLCKDDKLCFFINSTRFFVLLTEQARRWGRRCPRCPNAKAHTPCPNWGEVEAVAPGMGLCS